MAPAVLKYVPDDSAYDFGADLVPQLLRAGVPVYGWPLPSGASLIDIGTPENYALASRSWPARPMSERGGNGA